MILEVSAFREWRLLNSRDQLTWCLFSADAILYSWLCSIIFLFWSFSKGCTKLEHINISWCTQISSHGLKLLSQGCKNLLIFIAEGCCLVRKQTWFAINIYILHCCVLACFEFLSLMVNSLYVYIILCCSRKCPYCSPPPSHPPQNELEIPGRMRRAQTSKNTKVYLQFSREVGRGLRKIPSTREAPPSQISPPSYGWETNKPPPPPGGIIEDLR